MYSMPVGKGRDFCLNANARLNVEVGSVRSTKTVNDEFKALHDIATLPPGNIMFVGRTISSLYRNMLQPISEMVGADNFQMHRNAKEVNILGRTCYVEGATDESAQEKILGLTLLRLYGDEVTTWPESFLKTAQSRLSQKGAQADLTTNPAGRNCWFKKHYVDNPDLDIKIWHFTLEDNPFLDEDYKREIKIEYGPENSVWYKRYILGEFTDAEGLIYSMFDPDKHVVKTLPDTPPRVLMVGVDYGTSNPTCFLKVKKYGLKWIVTNEHYYDPAEKGHCPRTDSEHSAAFKDFLNYEHPTGIEVDPSAASFKIQLAHDGFHRVHSADNDVIDGIRRVANALATGKLLIHESCTCLIEQPQTYGWDTKKQEVGIDAPIKVNDHAVDALRYVANKIFHTPHHLARQVA